MQNVTGDTETGTAESGIRILLADDDFISQRVAQSLLSKLGCNPDIVGNGKEAVRALELKNYDLVLMDCIMPEIDGFEATAIIRDEKSHVLNHAVFIIAMTGNTSIKDREKCCEAGMNDYLSKPLKMNELADILEKWVTIIKNIKP